MTNDKAQAAAREYVNNDYWGKGGSRLLTVRNPDLEKPYIAGYAQGQRDLLEAAVKMHMERRRQSCLCFYDDCLEDMRKLVEGEK